MLTFNALKEEAREWCSEDRNPWIRLPLLLYGFYILLKILRGDSNFTTLGFLNYAIHEIGHVIFSPFGEWIGVAGGSFFQVFVPLYGIWQFHKQRDFFAMSFCLCWLSENLQYLSVYIADAQKMALPPLTPFNVDVVIHDWNYLLDSMHLLGSENSIAKLFVLAAFLFCVAFLISGSWLLTQIWMAQGSSKNG